MFARIVDTIDFSLPPIPPIAPATKETLRKFDNQNELLKQMDWATGVKTGSTPYAKYCLVASGTREGVSLIAVVLGAESDAVRWKEAKALLNYGLSLHPWTVLVSTGEVIAEVNVNDPIGRRVRLVTAGPLVARLSRDNKVRSMVALDRGPTLPVRAGEVFGRMDFVSDSTIIGSVELIAAQPLERPTIAADPRLTGGLRDRSMRGCSTEPRRFDKETRCPKTPTPRVTRPAPLTTPRRRCGSSRVWI